MGNLMTSKILAARVGAASMSSCRADDWEEGEQEVGTIDLQTRIPASHSP